jgi:hypothetical protein
MSHIWQTPVAAVAVAAVAAVIVAAAPAVCRQQWLLADSTASRTSAGAARVGAVVLLIRSSRTAAAVLLLFGGRTCAAAAEACACHERQAGWRPQWSRAVAVCRLLQQQMTRSAAVPGECVAACVAGPGRFWLQMQPARGFGLEGGRGFDALWGCLSRAGHQQPQGRGAEF